MTVTPELSRMRLRPRGDRAEEHGRRRREEVARVTLADGDRVEAELLGAHRRPQGLLEPVGGRGLPTGERVGTVGDDVEQLELHAVARRRLGGVHARQRVSSPPPRCRSAGGCPPAAAGTSRSPCTRTGRLTARLKSITVHAVRVGRGIPQAAVRRVGRESARRVGEEHEQVARRRDRGRRRAGTSRPAG